MSSTNSMLIRKIESSDNRILAQIIRTVFEEFDAPRQGTVYSDPTTDKLFDLFGSKDLAICLVAKYQGEVVGCCGIYPTDNLPEGYAELVKFYLLPTARGKGIGKALFEQCIDHAIQMGYAHLYIESEPSFSNAVKMYEKYGFGFIDHPLGDSGHDGCNIWMTKALQQP